MRRTIEVTELILRDAQQRLLATRMALENRVSACEDIDKAGLWSVECWGGATFEACIRFLNEDPWKRLRTFRKLMLNSRLGRGGCGGTAGRKAGWSGFRTSGTGREGVPQPDFGGGQGEHAARGENKITAPIGGTEFKVKVGDSVKNGQVVLTWA